MTTNRLEPGEQAPMFCLPNQDEVEVCLSDFKGEKIVVYFYPKDMTPGCSIEAHDFNEMHDELAKRGYRLIGISPDSATSHRKFREKLGLKFDLLSDPDHQVMESFGAWGTKVNYGKETTGVIRSTFVIDQEGKIEHALYGVKAKGHVERLIKLLG
jgi:peroxiredoxin Q/BCP